MKCVFCSCVLTISLATSVPATRPATSQQPEPVQVERWTQLNTDVEQLLKQGKYAEAMPFATQAAQVAEATFGPQDLRTATSLNTLGDVCTHERKYSEAESQYRRALGIREKALGPEHLDVAQTLNNLGDLFDDEGKYSEAESQYRRALDIREKALGPEHLDVAQTLNNLGISYYHEGRYDDAEFAYLRAARIREKKLGPEHPQMAASLNNLAVLYVDEGKYREVEPLYKRVLAIHEKTRGPESPRVAESLAGLGKLFRREGRYADAETAYRRALEIYQKLGGTDNTNVALTLHNMASLYVFEGKYSEAESLSLRALGILEKLLGPDHPSVAMSLSNLARLYQREGKYIEAEDTYQKALNIWLRALGAEHPHIAAILDDFAGLYHEEGKLVQAEPMYERSLAMHEKLEGSEHPDVADTLESFANLRFAQQLPNKAQPLYSRAFEILFHQFEYSFTYMTESDRLAFLTTVAERFPHYYSFVYQYHEQNPELVGKMYDLLLWQKGFIARSIAALRRQVEAGGDPEALNLLDQMAAKRTQISALLNAQPQDRDAWRKQLEVLEQQANDLETALVRHSSVYAQQRQLDRVTWRDVSSSLRSGEAAVEFANFPYFDGKKLTDKSYYVALVVTRETKTAPIYVVIGEAKQVEGAPLVGFQKMLRSKAHKYQNGFGPLFKSSAAQAYDVLWRPLEGLLVSKHRVYLSPDGMLTQVPLGLVICPGGRLLMEKHDLRVLFSTKDLLRHAGTKAENTAVLVGNPEFELTEAQYRAAMAKLESPGRKSPVTVARLSPLDRSRDLLHPTDQRDRQSSMSLPYTEAEVRGIATLLEGIHWHVITYTGDLAVEESVKRVRHPRVLHVATHGFFLPDQALRTQMPGHESDMEDPMLRSGLLFSGAARSLIGQGASDDLDDGILTSYEAASLDLQGTELVVLSACNTGGGDVRNGEGVFGLRRAFQEAGSESVLMSLWSVPDRETQELMLLFYEKWATGTNKQDALRQAQLEMRRRVQRRYGHDFPFYWGAFVMIGQ